MIKLASRVSALSMSMFLGAFAAGCVMQGGAENVDQATQLLSEDGAEAVSSSDQSTSEMTDVTLEVTSMADPSAAADALLAVPADPTDASCRTRAKDPNDPATVIITLNDCTGRFGLHHVSGKEIVHFTMGAAGVIHADFHSDGLTFDGRPASHTASADITVNGTERDVTWQGSWQRTNAKGAPVSHTSDLTITVDTVARCRTRNGTAVTTVGNGVSDRVIDSKIENVQVCRDAAGKPGCPTGTVVHTGKANGRSITVTFDGTDTAEISGPRGTFERPLVCGG